MARFPGLGDFVSKIWTPESSDFRHPLYHISFPKHKMHVQTCLGADDPTQVQRKRLQRVEILKIAEPCPLIDPSQVVVTQGEILVADPVLTPIGKFLYLAKR